MVNDLSHIADELMAIVTPYASKCRTLTEEDFSSKPRPEKWSKKEVLGHLIDSGQNNLRRFICGQYESAPPKVVYDQDFWVNANRYQHRDHEAVIRSWELVNQQIAEVLRQMPAANQKKLADTGKNEIQLRTLEWLATDYTKHLKHHLNQIFPNAFDVTYP